MRYTDVQQMRKQADAAYESYLNPGQSYRPNPAMGSMSVEPASDTWAYNKARDLYGYANDFKEAWPDIKKHPVDATKAFAKGLSARTADATQGLYDLVVGKPAQFGSWAGDKLNDLTYWGLNRLSDRAASGFNNYRLAYKDAIPQSQDQVQLPMDAAVHAVDNAVQSSNALKEKQLSGKAQEVMRRLGGLAGTAGETALYAGAFGGLSGLQGMLEHPVSAFGSDLAVQYGLGNRQSESLAAGAGRTYWQQAQEKANQIASNWLEQENKQNGVSDPEARAQAERDAAQLAYDYTPLIYVDYLQGQQYK